MSEKSGIEWLIGADGTLGSTWNPIRARYTNPVTGEVRIGWHCEHASEGCRFCYAEKINQGFFQLGTGQPYTPPARETVEIFLDDETLKQPLRWRKPRRIFPCSMTDAFAGFVSDEWLDKMFAVAALCPQHTFIFLTKRAMRMLKYFSSSREEARQDAIGEQAYHLTGTLFSGAPDCSEDFTHLQWPLPNVMLGFSAEDQKNFDKRWEASMAIAASGWAVWCSAEPLLGPIDARSAFTHPYRLSQMVVGGESGPNARPMHPNWARSLRDQCVAGEVPFFFKQWGEWKPICEMSEVEYEALYKPLLQGAPANSHRKCKADTTIVWPNGETGFNGQHQGAPHSVFKVGKKKAGRLLDGVAWDQYPR